MAVKELTGYFAVSRLTETEIENIMRSKVISKHLVCTNSKEIAARSLLQNDNPPRGLRGLSV